MLLSRVTPTVTWVLVFVKFAMLSVAAAPSWASPVGTRQLGARPVAPRVVARPPGLFDPSE